MKNILFRKILYIVAVLSVLTTIIGGCFIPSITKWYYNNFTNLDVPQFMVVFLYITIIPFLLILIEVMKLSKSLLKDSYLNKETIYRLKRISIYAFVEFIIYLIATTFVYSNLVFFVITIATLMIFMITAVIKELVSTGIELKEENDLTI